MAALTPKAKALRTIKIEEEKIANANGWLAQPMGSVQLKDEERKQWCENYKARAEERLAKAQAVLAQEG